MIGMLWESRAEVPVCWAFYISLMSCSDYPLSGLDSLEKCTEWGISKTDIDIEIAAGLRL